MVSQVEDDFRTVRREASVFMMGGVLALGFRGLVKVPLVAEAGTVALATGLALMTIYPADWRVRESDVRRVARRYKLVSLAVLAAVPITARFETRPAAILATAGLTVTVMSRATPPLSEPIWHS